MLAKYSEYFEDTSLILNRFSETLSNIEFDEEKEGEEIFNLTTIKLLSQNNLSISILLKNKHYSSVAALLRIIIESFFSIHWVTDTNDDFEKLNRIYRLEADTSFHYEKEVRLMEADLKSESPHWKPEAIKVLRDAVEREKKKFPYLLEIKDGKKIFKSAPGIAERMSEKLRVKYYHFYIFTSFFSHPSPKLKEFFLTRIDPKKNSELRLFEALAKTMKECLAFTVGILGYTFQIYDKYEKTDTRLDLFNSMKKIAENSQITYNALFKKPK